MLAVKLVVSKVHVGCSVVCKLNQFRPGQPSCADCSGFFYP